MLSKTMHDTMNDQIKMELESAYIYLSMAAYFDEINLPGFAHWMKMQFQEEQSHAFKFYDFICDRGGRVNLQAIAAICSRKPACVIFRSLMDPDSPGSRIAVTMLYDF